MEALIDIPVLLIFFNRPSKIEEVFNSVKKAKPTRLYLYQDGARTGREDDIDNVRLCREIVSDVDWNCEVHTYYQNENYGCDPSEFIAQRWFFDNEEYGIVLEDDDVPSVSFFRFAKELLEKYKDNERVAIICGMNNYDVNERINESYFFSKRGSIWGWASWRRFIDLWDEQYGWINDRTKCERIKQYCTDGLDYDLFYNIAQNHKNTGRAHYESIMFACAAMNNMVNIVPKYNMISNIGVDQETTHGVSDIRLLSKRARSLLYKKTYEIEFPLVHPEGIAIDVVFDRKYKMTFFQRIIENLEKGCRRIIYGDVRGLFSKISSMTRKAVK